MKPEPMITVSQWADERRILDATSSAAPGKYSTSVTPYLEEMGYHLSVLSPAEIIDFCKSSQVGGSELLNNFIGYVIDIAPGPMLTVQPTVDMAEKYSKTRIQPMINASPTLRKKVPAPKSRDGNNTMLQKEFPYGVLYMTGSNSPSSLASMPIRYVGLDEVDRYPLDLKDEGSPIKLAEARQRTFKSNKKMFVLSTPTTEDASIIWKRYLSTDQRKYYAPCPHCAGMQHLVLEQLRYDWNSDTETATNVYYECEHCQEAIKEYEKPNIIKSGVSRWIATAPEKTTPKRVGYHINAFYSPLGWYSWDDIAAEYEKAKNDILLMKSFYNTVLGLPSVSEGDVPEYEMLYNKRETYQQGTVQNPVGLITAGVDVQKDRIELEIVGYAKGMQSYSIDYRVLPGTTSGADSPVWKALAEVLEETFLREDGAQMKIEMMFVDSGYNTSEVYKFCNRFPKTRVVPVKGDRTGNQSVMVAHPKATRVNSKGQTIGKTKVWSVAVSMIKTELYGWLSKNINEDGTYPDGYCHFPQYEQQYFQGLASEKVVLTTNKKGQKVYAWQKFYARNEPLDCRVYARGAAHFKGADLWKNEAWDKKAGVTIVNNIEEVAKPKPKKRRNRNSTKSNYWD